MRSAHKIIVSSLCFFIVYLVLLPFHSVRVTGQTERNERLVSELSKHIEGIAWLKEDTILATAGNRFLSREATRIKLATGELSILANGACASPSPDGMKMAWVPGPESVGDVWILDLQNLARRQLTAGLGVATRLVGRCLAWSPDGRHIAAVTVRPEAYVVGTREISIISADNGRIEYLISAGGLSFDSPAWTADSHRLAVGVTKMGAYDFAKGRTLLDVNRVDVFDLGNRQSTMLLSVQEKITPAHDLALSPDGRTLLFVVADQIFAYNGMSIERIVSGHSPIWQPDGKAILFAREFDETWNSSRTSLYMVEY